MAHLTRKQTYHCYNDCSQAGCSGHKMVVEYNSVTDGIAVHFNGNDYYFDPTTLALFLKLLKSMDRVEIDSILKEVNET